MTCEVYNYVRYCPKDDYFVVGDNETEGSGLEPSTYEGEIVIPSKYKGKEIPEICNDAFMYCLITKVKIFAKLKIINKRAFCHCSKLTYINIPSSVTFIGFAALSFANLDFSTVDLAAIIDFDPGRKNNIYIDGHNFGGRSNFSIFYPSSIKPTYSSTNAFSKTNSSIIYAPSSFDFYTKNTTVINFFRLIERNVNTCKMCVKHNNSFFASFLIFLCVHSFDKMKAPAFARKKNE